MSIPPSLPLSLSLSLYLCLFVCLSVSLFLSDTPAARSGIKSGDDLISVNNKPLQNMDHNEVTALIQKVRRCLYSLFHINIGLWFVAICCYE